MQTTSSRASSPGAPPWHAKFMMLLPAIELHAKRAFRRLAIQDREEAVQAVVAFAVVAYSRLDDLQKPELGYATPLARFGVKYYRAGRLIGSRVSCRDVGSAKCRLRGCIVEPLEDWKEALCENRRATPAEIAALRIDFGDWLQTLSPRDRRLAKALASGEETSGVAKMFAISAGRVSQLRRELHKSWQQFTGETTAAGASIS